MNKIKVAKATVNGNESLIFIVLDPDGRKMCMTMAELDDDGITDVIVTDDGFIVSKDEVGYEDHEEEYKEMFDKQELGETFTISPTSHSCLATNKQILLKDEIKQNKLFNKVQSGETVSIALYSYMHLILKECISLNIQRKRQNINKHKTAEL